MKDRTDRHTQLMLQLQVRDELYIHTRNHISLDHIIATTLARYK